MEDFEIKPQVIVIAEDNYALGDIYKTRLELLGYECHLATDGEMAYDVIERLKPDLVLMDLMMPKLSGDQVLAKVRATDWGKSIRVFIISNLNENEAPGNLRALGIEGYAIKANLTDDDIDRLVDKILTPKGQEEDIVLE